MLIPVYTVLLLLLRWSKLQLVETSTQPHLASLNGCKSTRCKAVVTAGGGGNACNANAPLNSKYYPRIQHLSLSSFKAASINKKRGYRTPLSTSTHVNKTISFQNNTSGSTGKDGGKLLKFYSFANRKQRFKCALCKGIERKEICTCTDDCQAVGLQYQLSNAQGKRGAGSGLIFYSTITSSFLTPANKCLAYVVLDTIKIFGRLAEKSVVGYVIAHSTNKTLFPIKPHKKRNWELLFENKAVLTKEAFTERLLKLPFFWPLTINSGQLPERPVIDVPVAPKVFIDYCHRIKDKLDTAASLNGTFVSSLVEQEQVAIDAIDCLFTAADFILKVLRDVLSYECVYNSFTDKKNGALRKEDVKRCINEWAPTDGLVDWNTFVYHLTDLPQDNLENFFD